LVAHNFKQKVLKICKNSHKGKHANSGMLHPAHVDPAPDAEGGDPDDSSDDSGDDDSGNNADENPEEEEDEDPRYHGAVYHKHSTEDENGQFCISCGKFYSTWVIP
jgi:hypothetical protein